MLRLQPVLDVGKGANNLAPRRSDGGARVWCGVRTFAVAPLPNSGARSCAGVYTFAAAPLPNSGARSVMWRGDCSECVRGVMSLYVCVGGDGYRPCTDGSRGPPF